MDDSDKRNRIFFSDHSIVNHLRFFKRKGKTVMNMENMRLWDKMQKIWVEEPFWVGTNNTYIIQSNGKFQEVSADQYILQKSTGKTDQNLKEIFEGDLVESQVGGQKIEIKYGRYKAFCPADQEYMDNIGFYAACEGYMDMPIGPLEEYAVWIGNIFMRGDEN